MKLYSSIFCLLALFSTFTVPAICQDRSKTSSATVGKSDRVNKLVDVLGIKDPEKKWRTSAIISRHFDSLDVIFKDREKALESSDAVENKELAAARGRSARDAANSRLNKVYASFLGRLSTELTADQIEKLKNEMTEGGMLREYNNYLDLFPDLTGQQKAQLTAYLNEARENAMNAETAAQRKEWFIKYRGRANNFLAAAGYDLRKATDEQKKRNVAKLKAQ